MQRTLLPIFILLFLGASLQAQLICTAIYDAQPGASGVKGYEFYALSDIPDLSVYELGVANNGGGTDSIEYSFPADVLTEGDFIYVANDSTMFADFFGFNANYISGISNINGDDALEVYENAVVIDTYGDVELDGTGEVWEYTDGWAYRKLGTGPDAIFNPSNWIYSGTNALDNEATNDSAATPVPIGSYFIPTMTDAQDDVVMTGYNQAIDIDILANDFLVGEWTSIIILDVPSSGIASINFDGSMTYSPDTDACGEDQFAYEVCDASSCDTATVFITVECPPSYPQYSIAEVTTNDMNGFPDSLNVLCALTGRVYGGNINGGGLSFVIMDDMNNGIVVYNEDNNFGYTPTEGDVVDVWGSIGFFNGITEIIIDSLVTSTASIAEVSPTVVSTLDESTESSLVTLSGVSIVDNAQWDNTISSSGFNVQVTNGVDTFVIRIDNDNELFNMANPLADGALYDITGLGGQFDDFSSPFDMGYQLLPRYAADIQMSVSNSSITLGDQIRFFPNPATTELIIELEEAVENIQISTIDGRQVVRVSNPSNYEKINTSTFTKGIYLITFLQQDRFWSEKLIIK